METPDSILVINVSRIGDTLLVTPALRALAAHWPKAEITVLAHPKRAEVLENLPGIARVGRIEKHRAPFCGHWPGKTHDLALVYGHDRALLDYALRTARRVVAFRQTDERLNARFYRTVDEPLPHAEHAVERALRLTDALDVPQRGRRLVLRLRDEEIAWGKTRVAAEGLAATWPLIGLQVASFPTKAYRDWPVEHFAELCERAVTMWPRAAFVILGGGEEKARTAWLKARLGMRAALLAGHLTLRQTAAIMAELHAYVGVDTGPTHLMGTFDIPLLGLYHPRFPQSAYGPLEHPLNFSLDHPGKTGTALASMTEIGVDTVFNQLIKALASGKFIEPAHGAQP